MPHSLALDTRTELINIDTSTIPQGMSYVVVADKSWWVLDKTSTDAAIADQIVIPTVGSGRWFRANNTANRLNTITSVTTTTATTTADFTSAEQVRVIFTQNSTINLQTTLRNGAGVLLLDRNNGSWTISGFDSRFRWGAGNSPFAFSSNFAMIYFVCINNLIYVTRVTSY